MKEKHTGIEMDVKGKRSRFEQYKRIVKFLGSLAIVLLELALYYFVWMNYYNRNLCMVD